MLPRPSSNSLQRVPVPGLGFESWRTAMTAGEFHRAWSINDACSQHWPSAHHFWNGRFQPKRRLVLTALHGLGDAVQMMQYAGVLCDAGVEVSLRVPEALEPLLPYFKPVGVLAPLRAAAQDDAEMMELPHLFRTQVQELPIASRYLCLPQQLTDKVKEKLGAAPGLRVGLVWRGGDWDRSRWVPTGDLDALADVEGADFWNLQSSPALVRPSRLPMRFAGELCGEGLLPLAAVIANMDVMVTVDTLAAHIAGALGVKTLLLLKHDADWRWMTGPRSPWYPSLRLLRQPTPGDWAAVLSEVKRTLRAKVARTIPLSRAAARRG